MIKFSKVDQHYYPLVGGLDLLTPAISVKPGRVSDSQNYEPEISGGYRRIDGFERFDGHSSPSSAAYWILPITQTGTIAVGDTITGATSGATGKVLGIFGANLVLGRVSGSFTASENLTDSAVLVAAAAGPILQNGATLPSDHADYTLLAANDWRMLIGAVPGSGQIRGVWVYKDVVYAFRDNAGGTAGQMWQSSTGGWIQIALGREILFSQATTPSATVTMTVASPAVITWNAHGLQNGQPVVFTTTGALPTGLTAGTTYYVINAATNTFQVAATVGGAAINTSGVQSGTHTATATVSPTLAVGDTITGATSGATAVVKAVLLRSGTWTVSPVGSLVFATVTGAFQIGENILKGGAIQVKASTADTAITRLPGGSMDFANVNFTGSTATQKMYGVDGVNPGFEFDGTTYVPIHTGMTVDTPTHVIGHKNYLFYSFLGSVQLSALGNPYSWSPVLGANEIGVGDPVTGFMPAAGSSVGDSSLAIFTKGRAHILYGASSSSFRLVTSKWDMGFSAFTMQPVSNDIYGLTARGIQALTTTLDYGDFDYASVSHMIQPFMTSKKGLETCSTTLHTKNQYRIYFSDGTGLVVGLNGQKVNGLLPLNYGKPVRCMCTAELSTGLEVTYFGSDDGYIYQDNIGTSFDGSTIEAWCRVVFNNLGSPQIRKRIRRAVFEVTVTSYCQVNISYDIGYGNPDVQPSAVQPNQSLIGGGGYWDKITWDQFNWDVQSVLNPSVSIDGTEKNISFIFYSNRAQDQSHTFQGITFLSSIRRTER
jgi:hypothetical protein